MPSIIFLGLFRFPRVNSFLLVSVIIAFGSLCYSKVKNKDGIFLHSEFNMHMVTYLVFIIVFTFEMSPEKFFSILFRK